MTMEILGVALAQLLNGLSRGGCEPLPLNSLAECIRWVHVFHGEKTSITPGSILMLEAERL